MTSGVANSGIFHVCCILISCCFWFHLLTRAFAFERVFDAGARVHVRACVQPCLGHTLFFSS